MMGTGILKYFFRPLASSNEFLLISLSQTLPDTTAVGETSSQAVFCLYHNLQSMCV